MFQIRAFRSRSFCALIVALAGMYAAASFAADAKETKKPAAAKSAIQGEYAIMVKSLGLEGDQLAAFTKAVEARGAAAKAWEAANADKIAELEKASGSDNPTTAKQAKSDLRKLTTERNTALDEHRAKILATLNKDQQITWQGFNFYRGAMTKYKKLDLTDAQTTKVRELCDAASKEAGLIDEDAKDARSSVSKKLGATIEKDVLTDEQRAKLTSKPEKKPEAK